MEQTHSPRHRGRVLVIDDDDTARTGIVRILEGNNFEVFELVSPIGAVELMLRKGVEAVVIDVNMPTMRGERVVELFRKHKRLKDLVIVLVSGDDEVLEELGGRFGDIKVLSKAELRMELATVLRVALAPKPHRTTDELWAARFPSRAPGRGRDDPSEERPLGERILEYDQDPPQVSGSVEVDTGDEEELPWLRSKKSQNG
jgi:CheY-like chemotaxis protein